MGRFANTMSTDTQTMTVAAPPRPAGAQQHAAVVGLQWGDEGKGKVVDLLTREYDVIVRYNGGANAGHSVVVDGQRYALHLIPCGILDPRKLNVIANGVVVDPATVLEEIDMLAGRGVEIGENLRLSDRAHLVLPYHKQQDLLMEAAVSATRGEGKKVGTTGRGMGPAYADKALRTTALRVGDLYDRERFLEKLRHTVAVKNAMLSALAKLAGAAFEPVDAEQLGEQYLEYAQVLRPHVCDTTQLMHE
jgi:adenylosuccinate synthase